MCLYTHWENCLIKIAHNVVTPLQNKLRHVQEKAAEATSQNSSLLDKIKLLEEKLTETDTKVKELKEQVSL